MSAAEAPVRQGDVLAGKYRVDKVLGVGGMGVVVAAMHLELDQRVALKFLLPAAADKPEVIARFAREARAAAKIKSEHVARVSDVGTLESGLPYIVMEFLDGADLAEMLGERGRLPVSQAVGYILQACDAIAEAHARGIVHRDLKPGNLFIARQPDGSEKLKVLDFGISKAVITASDPSGLEDAKLTKTTDIFGSPMYMSPEQLRSARDVDHRADIWALGAILMELLTGKAPFEKNTIAEIFGAILHERAPLLRDRLPSAPEELERVVDRCLQKDADQRFPHVANLAQALLPFGPSSSRPAAERAMRVARRAGVAIASVPPPPGEDEAAPTSDPIPLRSARPEDVAKAVASTALAPPAAASTRTSWGKPETTAAPRSARRFVAIGVALGAAVALGGLAVLRAQLAPAPASDRGLVQPHPEAALTASSAAPAPPSQSTSPIASASGSASAPTPAESSSAAPSAAPLVAPSAPLTASSPSAEVPAVSASSAPKPHLTGRLPVRPAPSGRPAPPPAQDPDDFGGRL
ncbi:MAG: protein kinase [Byssovorax sp.]